MVERLPVKKKVAGPSPAGGASDSLDCTDKLIELLSYLHLSIHILVYYVLIYYFHGIN